MTSRRREEAQELELDVTCRTSCRLRNSDAVPRMCEGLIRCGLRATVFRPVTVATRCLRSSDTVKVMMCSCLNESTNEMDNRTARNCGHQASDHLACGTDDASPRFSHWRLSRAVSVLSSDPVNPANKLVTRNSRYQSRPPAALPIAFGYQTFAVGKWSDRH